MFSEGHENKKYQAYLVRMWQVGRDGQVVWRASAEDAHSGERRAFADLAHLFAFLEEAALSNQTDLKNKEHTND